MKVWTTFFFGGVRSRAARFGAVGTLASGVVACVPTFDDDLPLITEPQVLAVKAEPAEAAPGEEVELSALAVSPRANGAAPSLSWGLCRARKPLTELGPVSPECIRAPNANTDAIVALGAGATVMATLPADACRLFGPSLPEAMNGEPPGRPVDPDPSGGFYQPIGVTLRETGETTLGAVRIFCPPSGLDLEQSVAFNGSYRRNLNPVIDGLSTVDEFGNEHSIRVGTDADPDAGGEVLRVRPGESVRFAASWAGCSDDAACSGAEAYVVFNADTRQLDAHHESIRVSWFTTAGRLDHAVTGRDEDEFANHRTENTWTAPTSAGKVALWAVIRDARGGQSFRRFFVQVER